jgi:hypothetical protein
MESVHFLLGAASVLGADTGAIEEDRLVDYFSMLSYDRIKMTRLS